MRCFYVSKRQISGKQIQILASELHHLSDVLRLQKGDEITVLDGVGGVYDVLLVSVSTHLAIGEIRSWKQVEPSPIEVTLIQGISKSDSMDMIIQKATELGVYKIIPALCQRTVPNFTTEKAQKRVIRWNQIAVEASKQSRRPFFPKIHDITKFNDSLNVSQADLKLIFTVPSIDSVCPQKLKDILRQRTDTKKVQIIVGPEGDFTDDEINDALSVDAIPVSLGSNILRTETASIAGLAIVLYELTNDFHESNC
jgi:16S rRNA (uracil1498-N3)-methyltransferase